MTRRPVLKVLSNGYEVPYPEELIYNDLLFLKDYRLNAFPKTASGEFDREIFRESYEKWLQAYLYSCDIDLTKEQRKINDYISARPDFGGFWIGNIGGHYENCHALHPRYEFPDDFEDNPDISKIKGHTCRDPYEDILEWCRQVEEDPPTRLEHVLEEYGWVLMRRQEEAEFRKHWPGFAKLEPLHWMFEITVPILEPPDAAWRTYLALTLKRIPDKEGRCRQLERFFVEYGDMIHK